jgi:hypothetical protein
MIRGAARTDALSAPPLPASARSLPSPGHTCKRRSSVCLPNNAPRFTCTPAPAGVSGARPRHAACQNPIPIRIAGRRMLLGFPRNGKRPCAQQFAIRFSESCLRMRWEVEPWWHCALFHLLPTLVHRLDLLTCRQTIPCRDIQLFSVLAYITCNEPRRRSNSRVPRPDRSLEWQS